MKPPIHGEPASPSPGECSLAPGDLVDHFQVMRHLGHGGMGDVYLARDAKLGRKVALKLVRPAALGTPDAVERFLREARTTARFSHPNIVTIYAVGEHQGRPYVALEYVEGQTLRTRINADRPSWREAVRLALAIAEALAEAHRRGILHRDLKPENIMLPRDGRLRVLDFGLAKPFGEAQQQTAVDMTLPISGPASVAELFISRAGHIAGTPPYMAPEQWSGETCSGATDIWALGIILYELISGATPYPGLAPAQLALRVVQPEPIVAPAAPGGTPTELLELVARCLDKDPAKRPAAHAFAEALQRLVGGGLSQVVGDESPFRGLSTFDRHHAALFFGREAEVALLVERLRTEPVLALVGPSGAGKSSLVQAGLIPRLVEQGRLIVVQLRPGMHPARTLAARLLSPASVAALDVSASRSGARLPSGAASGPAAPDPNDEQQLAQELLDQPRLLAIKLRDLAVRERATVLLFVDQLEELYTLVGDEAKQRAFLAAIGNAADDPQDPVRVLFTLRDDFLGRLAGGPDVGEALGRVTVVQPPGPEALEQILTRSLEVVGYRYEDPALVQDMIAEVRGEVSCLPLLQFACSMLWERRDRQRRLLLRTVYEEIGGVAGALARQADSVLEGLSSLQLALARAMLLRLVTPDGTRKVLARASVLEGVAAEAEPVLDRLIAARLVTQRKARGEHGAEALVELAHGSLVQTWARLARWVDESREELTMLAELGQAAELWHRRGCRADELWRGDALHEVRRMLARHPMHLPDPLVRFLAAAQRREQRRAWRKRSVVVLSFTVLAAVALMLFAKERETRRQKEQAETQRLAAEQHRAHAQLEGARAAFIRGNLLEARAKLRGSLETQDTPLGRALWWQISNDARIWSRDLGTPVHDVAFAPDGRTVAVACQNQTVYLFDVLTLRTRALRGHDDQVRAVAFSPDGRRLASATWRGEIRLWDLVRGTVRRLDGHQGAVWSLDFSGDGRWLASASWDRTIRLWDMRGGGAARTLLGHTDHVRAVRFSPDNATIASAGTDRTIRIWDAAAGKELRTLRGHGSGIRTLAFSPDGSRLVSAGSDSDIRVWDVRAGTREVTLVAGTAPTHRVAFHSDGRSLAVGRASGSVELWDIASKRMLRHLEAHDGVVSSVAFSPDGGFIASVGVDRRLRLWSTRNARRSPSDLRKDAEGTGVWGVDVSMDGALVAAGGYDRQVRIFDVASGTVQRTLEGHTARVTAANFGPGGRQLASGSYDQTVRIWTLDSNGSRRLVGHTMPVLGVRFSPDESLLASSSGDKTVRIWDVEAGTTIRMLSGHEKSVWDVAFSPDGRRLASSSQDGTVRIWDTRRWRLQQQIAVHSGAAYGLAFSPDGAQLAIGCEDGAVRRWDLRSRGPLQVVGRHPGRVYYLAFHPDGQRIGAAGSDGIARIWDRAGQHVALRGHRAEVNYLRFSHDGRLAVTGSDDGTVRLWDVASGRPYWHTPGLLPAPLRSWSHRGWIALDGTKPAAPAAAWRSAVEHARLLSADARSGRLCLARHGGGIELWNLSPARRRFADAADGVQQIVALPDGCLVRVQGAARLYLGDGSFRDLHPAATAVAHDGARMLVAAGTKLLAFDAAGRQVASYEADVGVTAIARVSGKLLVGYRNGSIEHAGGAGGPGTRAIPLEHGPAAEVVRLIEGPAGTVVAGFANGSVGIWNIDNGIALARRSLHGPVRHLLWQNGRLYAASELGDHRVLDLRIFARPRCELLRQIWKQVPVVWEQGLLALRPPPAQHPCAAR